MAAWKVIGSLLIDILRRVFKHLLLQIRVYGWAKAERLLAIGEPLILVCNHIGSYGPVSIISALPSKLYPWVAHEVTEIRKVARHLQREFTELELKLRPPLSIWLARLIGRICVAIMRSIEAIPVYAGSRRIRKTLERSLELLLRGKTLLVFPEDKDRPINEVLGEFNTGFLNIARMYYRRTRKLIRFIPVAVNEKVKAIRIGKPIRFDFRLPFLQEKRRLKRRLQEEIYSMYYSLENELAPRSLPASAP